MGETRDKALWKVLYFKCQSCGEVNPIKQAVGIEFPPENGNVRLEIWCKSCFES